MGAWIEIVLFRSHRCLLRVAPYMGAWIEIRFCIRSIANAVVAPYMGAWIEISILLIEIYGRFESLPTWERGLKSVVIRVI